MLSLAGQSDRSVGWWAALIVYPGAIAVLMLIAAVIRDVHARRYWALLAPVLVLFAFCLGFVTWVVVALHSADFSVVD
jgi:NADH:ubiquinone oxidoreductase subunit 6 (subunit J)